MSKPDNHRRAANGLGLAAVAAWMATAAYYASGQLGEATGGGSVIALDTPAEGALESDLWFRAELENRALGYMRKRRSRAADGWVFQQDAEITLKLMGTPRKITISSIERGDEQLRLQSFNLVMSTFGMELKTRGVVQNRNVDLVIGEGEFASTLRFTMPREPKLDANLPRAVLAGEIGQRFKTAVFDPLTRTDAEVEIELAGKGPLTVGGATYTAFHLRTHRGAAAYDSWVDETGEELIAQGPMGLKLVRSPKDAIAAPDMNMPDITELAKIVPNREIPGPANIRVLKLTVAGRHFDAAALSDARQRVSGPKGEHWEIRRQHPEQYGAYTVPVTNRVVLPFTRPAFFMQSDHPLIQEKARMIVGDERNLLALARLLHDWIYEHMQKTPVVGVPDALNIVRDLRGDCNEHTTLYVALARSVGLPARVAAGVVYVHGAFMYHAWPEVWVGEWIAIDPTLGQFPADVTHLRLVLGGVDQQMEIAGMLGNLLIGVEDIQ